MRKEWGEKNQKNTVLLPVHGLRAGYDSQGGRQGLISRMQVNKRHLAIRIGVPDWSPTSRGSSQVALVVKNPPANAGDVRDMGLIPGGEHSNSPQCSCLENPINRGAWWATVHGVAKSWTQLSD